MVAALHIFNHREGQSFGVDCICGYKENFEEHDLAAKAAREHNYKCSALEARGGEM